MSKVLPILILSGLLFVSVPSVSYGDETWSPTLGGGMRSSNGTTWSQRWVAVCEATMAPPVRKP